MKNLYKVHFFTSLVLFFTGEVEEKGMCSERGGSTQTNGGGGEQMN